MIGEHTVQLASGGLADCFSGYNRKSGKYELYVAVEKNGEDITERVAIFADQIAYELFREWVYDLLCHSCNED